MIDELKAENQTQAKTIANQSAVISRLEFQAKEHERLTLELSKQETESRNKAHDVIKSISTQEKSSDAYHSNAPLGVIEFLRQE